ncbi:hypothetical protein WDU94_010939 [Cyamophila willieti]
MNHVPLPPLKQRLRSQKTVVVQNNPEVKKQNRVSFSIQPVTEIKAKHKLNDKNNLDKESREVTKTKTKSKTLQTRDAPQQSPVVPLVLTSNHTSDPSMSSITINSDPIHLNIMKPSPSNLTSPHGSLHTEHLVQISIGTQTDDSISSYVNVNERLVAELRHKDNEIESLKQKISSLESIIQASNSNLVNNPSVPQSNYRTNHQAKSNKTCDFSCYILGDSHVRGLQHILSKCIPDDSYDVYAYFQPGAGYKEVSTTHSDNKYLINPSNKDVVVLVCGTNDIGSTQWAVVQNAVDKLLVKFNHVRQICILGVPFRYRNKKLNYHIVRFNAKLKNYVLSKSKIVRFLDPNDQLRPQYYAKDGLHLNRQGKSILCNEINKTINSRADVDMVPSKPSTRETVSESIVCHDLIVLDDFEESLQTHIANVQYEGESTFSSQPFRNITTLFPETSCIDNDSNNTSVVHNTLVPNSVNNTFNSVPNVPLEPHCSSDYYRIANISTHNSFSANAAPIGEFFKDLDALTTSLTVIVGGTRPGTPHCGE